MRKLLLWPKSNGDRITFDEFIRRLKKERAIALITGDYGCKECDILKAYIRESGADYFIKYELVISSDEESIKEAQKAGIMHIPIIVDCFSGKCDMIIDTDPYAQYEELVRRLVEVYKVAKVVGEESL